MHEALHLTGDCRGNPPDHPQREFPLEYQSGKAETFQPESLLGRSDGTLGGSMQRYSEPPRKLNHSQVLDNHRICSGSSDILQHPPSLLQFILKKNRIQGHEDSCPETMGVRTKPRNLPDFIPRSLPCTEFRSGNIDRIGTAVNCRDADVSISCRSKEFQLTHLSQVVSSPRDPFKASGKFPKEPGAAALQSRRA